jgi:phage-related protein
MTEQSGLKLLRFRGTSKKDLLAFPEDAVGEAGYQLYQVQTGAEPDDWKAIKTVGQGCYEIRIDEGGDAFRIIYVAKFAQAVFVLHCFQKKTPQTAQRDIDLAKDRYKDLVQELKNE